VGAEKVEKGDLDDTTGKEEENTKGCVGGAGIECLVVTSQKEGERKKRDEFDARVSCKKREEPSNGKNQNR